VIEKTITIFRNKKPKKPKIWTFGFFLDFSKKPKNLVFLKSDFYSPGRDVGEVQLRYALIIS